MLQYVQRNLFDFDARLHLVPGPGGGARRCPPDGLDVHDHPAAGRDLGGRPPGDLARTRSSRSGKIVDPKIPSTVYKPVFEELASVEALDARRFRGAVQEAVRLPRDGLRPAAPARAPVRGPELPARRSENRAPLSNGPYRVVVVEGRRSPSSSSATRATPGPRGHFDRIVFRIVPDNTTAYRLLVDGRARRGPDRRRDSRTARPATRRFAAAAGSSSSTTSTTTTSP